jgi:1-acyl-sn-glycerol-3-phosphate acyltransferase
VQSWPGIGFLADLAGTVFIERRAHKSREQRDTISASLAAGNRLVLFPEGTSSDGSTVLPFKSALFSVFETGEAATEIAVQPITIDYAAFPDGRSIEGEQRDLYAWHGDMTLAPHLSRVIGLPGARVKLVWHEALHPKPPVNRKALARSTEQAVKEGMARLRGQPRPQDDALVTALRRPPDQAVAPR